MRNQKSDHGSDWRRTWFTVSLLLVLFVAGCAPAIGDAGPTTSFAAQLANADDPDLRAGQVELRGDPGFDAGGLQGDAARFHSLLWESIDDPQQREYIERLANSDNLYEYGRLVYTHSSALLLAFRHTGDLRLLDRVDDLTEMMRSHLDDSWRDVREGSAEEGRDGYPNWVWRGRGSPDHQGKDVHAIDEMRTHAFLAEVAWAFRNNEDLPSPKGIDYGERADFWAEHLRENFEAKWRERNEVRWPNFPFLQRPYMHPTLAMTKYHYYMYRLTGDIEYSLEARRLSDVLFGEFQQVETPVGDAFVWTRSISQWDGGEEYLTPTDYSSLVVADALSLHLDGFYGWADLRVPHYLANMVSQFLIDAGSSSFARDIGGGQRRAGIRPSSARDWTRVTRHGFAINTWAFLTAYDESGKIAQVAQDIWEDLPAQHRYPHIPAGLLTDAVAGDSLAATWQELKASLPSRDGAQDEAGDGAQEDGQEREAQGQAAGAEAD